MRFVDVHSIRSRVSAVCVAMLLVALPAVAQGTKAKAESTVITSDRLTFDYKNHFAVFDNNVLVTDPEMRMTCTKLTVQFGDKGAVKVIKAEGEVHITQVDKVARSQVATYDVESGKMVLAGKPRVTRGRDTLEGDVITFWRDDNKMTCQSRARLVIHPEKGGSRDSILGD
jgi:lipopolysaccharide export system protein LptA